MSPADQAALERADAVLEEPWLVPLGFPEHLVPVARAVRRAAAALGHHADAGLPTTRLRRALELLTSVLRDATQGG